MKILVLNSGSSSIKYKLFDISEEKEEFLDKGLVERIGEEVSTHKEAIDIIFSRIDMKIDVVGHRVVHGGDRFKEAVLVNSDIIKALENVSELAPLHNPAALLTITESQKILCDIPHIAVFDTAFYQTLPEYAYLYAVPYSFYEKHKIRKYGFHGTSHRYMALSACKVLKRPLQDIKLITCHLGNGCSITAIDKGKAVDTSMGFTPLEGLVMGTRSGDLDPAVIPYIMEKENLGIDRVMEILNKESGLLGISGISNDMREIMRESNKNKRARTALDIFVYRIKKYIGSYSAILGSIDAVVFTGGIGENQPELAKNICKEIIPSDTKILIIPTNEELMIARDAYNIIKL